MRAAALTWVLSAVPVLFAGCPDAGTTGAGATSGGVASPGPRAADADPRVVALYGGPARWDVIATATTAQARRMESPLRAREEAELAARERARREREGQPAPPAPPPAPAEAPPAPVQLTTAQLERLRELLADPASYEWEIAKRCAFDPGVAITFVSGAERHELQVCFSCTELASAGGTPEDFDPIEGEVVQLVQALFPQDAEIQALGR